MEVTFTATLFEWRGPAPYYWLALPPDAVDDVQAEAAATTYGWGAIPVRVRVGGSEWETSLLPRDGGYVMPVRKAVRLGEGLTEGGSVTVGLTVEPRGGRAATQL